MTIVAQLFEHVVGIDTHARTHTYCLLAAATGAVIDTAVFPTTKAGNARAVTWIVRRTSSCSGDSLPGTGEVDLVVVALDCSGLEISVPSAAVFLPVPYTSSHPRSVPRTMPRSSAMPRTVAPGVDSYKSTA